MSKPISNKILRHHAAWVLVVRENPSSYERSILGIAKSSEDVFHLVRQRILAEQCEVMYAVCLDGRNRVIHLSEVARGGLHGCSIAARDVLRVVLMCGASAFILVHNHPSGDPTPSPEDIVMTKKVEQAANVVGVPLVDHIIVGGWEKHSSLLNLGHIDP